MGITIVEKITVSILSLFYLNLIPIEEYILSIFHLRQIFFGVVNLQFWQHLQSSALDTIYSD